MKVKVIGNRRPVIDGAKRDAGYITNVGDVLGEHLIANGLAEQISVRARKVDGTYRGDDPSTPENEAYDPPKKPKRTPRKKKADK